MQSTPQQKLGKPVALDADGHPDEKNAHYWRPRFDKTNHFRLCPPTHKPVEVIVGYDAIGPVRGTRAVKKATGISAKRIGRVLPRLVQARIDRRQAREERKK